jgi:hypothetical protein
MPFCRLCHRSFPTQRSLADHERKIHRHRRPQEHPSTFRYHPGLTGAFRLFLLYVSCESLIFYTHQVIASTSMGSPCPTAHHPLLVIIHDLGSRSQGAASSASSKSFTSVASCPLVLSTISSSYGRPKRLRQALATTRSPGRSRTPTTCMRMSTGFARVHAPGTPTRSGGAGLSMLVPSRGNTRHTFCTHVTLSTLPR